MKTGTVAAPPHAGVDDATLRLPWSRDGALADGMMDRVTYQDLPDDA
jgi:hypothetical protein